jgi:hypothetical protein
MAPRFLFSKMVVFGAAICLSSGCTDRLPTDTGVARNAPAKIDRPISPNMVAYWQCQETTWLSDGTSVIECELDYYDDGSSGSGSPQDPGLPPEIVAMGSGSGSASGPTEEDPDVWTEAELANVSCNTVICNHVTAAFDPHWIGCPPRIFYSDPDGPHGPEVWSMRLVSVKWDWQALAYVGRYTGVSTINGYTDYTPFARNTCAVGFVIFRGIHL